MIILNDSKITELMWQMSPCTPALVAPLCSSAAPVVGFRDSAHQQLTYVRALCCQVAQRSLTLRNEPFGFHVQIQLPVVGPTFRVHTAPAWRLGFLSVLLLAVLVFLPAGLCCSVVTALPRQPTGPDSVAPLHLERSVCGAGCGAVWLLAACCTFIISYVLLQPLVRLCLLRRPGVELIPA